MSLFSTDSARPLGKGKQSPAGSLLDSELAAMFRNYKRAVAGSYRALPFEDLARGAVPSGPLQVSPKIDGELWFLVLDEQQAILCSPTGRVAVSGRRWVRVSVSKRMMFIRGRGGFSEG